MSETNELTPSIPSLTQAGFTQTPAVRPFHYRNASNTHPAHPRRRKTDRPTANTRPINPDSQTNNASSLAVFLLALFK